VSEREALYAHDSEQDDRPEASTSDDVNKHVSHDVTFGKGGPGGRCSTCHEDLTDEQGKAVRAREKAERELDGVEASALWYELQQLRIEVRQARYEGRQSMILDMLGWLKKVRTNAGAAYIATAATLFITALERGEGPKP
jgi:hypothetical protein